MIEQGKPVCTCYCSDKCGPRNIGERENDEPFIDQETGICFCQERDRENYKLNKCDKKPSQKTTCCG